MKSVSLKSLMQVVKIYLSIVTSRKKSSKKYIQRPHTNIIIIIVAVHGSTLWINPQMNKLVFYSIIVYFRKAGSPRWAKLGNRKCLTRSEKENDITSANRSTLNLTRIFLHLCEEAKADMPTRSVKIGCEKGKTHEEIKQSDPITRIIFQFVLELFLRRIKEVEKLQFGRRKCNGNIIVYLLNNSWIVNY